jgi:hypothetical protein
VGAPRPFDAKEPLDAKKPLPGGKRLLDVWTGCESGYVAEATPCGHALGIQVMRPSDTDTDAREHAEALPRSSRSLDPFRTFMVPPV